MLDLIRRLFGRTPAQETEVDEFLFGIEDDSSSYRSSSGPLLKGTSRGSDNLHACHISECVRPSSYTVMTTQTLDVDIPFATPDRIRRVKPHYDKPLTPYDTGHLVPLLPVYRQYFLCDRHYASLIRGQSGTAYVIGPDHVYDPDQDKRTQKKLAGQAI